MTTPVTADPTFPAPAPVPRTILRVAHGSHPEVVRVYAYDGLAGCVLCRLRYADGMQAIGEFDFQELEAFLDDGPRTLVDVDAHLCRVAEDLVDAERAAAFLPGVPS